MRINVDFLTPWPSSQPVFDQLKVLQLRNLVREDIPRSFPPSDEEDQHLLDAMLSTIAQGMPQLWQLDVYFEYEDFDDGPLEWESFLDPLMEEFEQRAATKPRTEPHGIGKVRDKIVQDLCEGRLA